MIDIILPIVIFVILWIIVVKAFKINLKPFKSKMFPLEVYPSSRDIRGSLAIIVLFAFMQFSFVLEWKPEGIKIPVQETDNATQFFHEDSVRPVVFLIDKIEIRGEPYLTRQNPGFGLTMLDLVADKKSNVIDLTFLLVVAILLAIGFWNFDFKNPFKIRVSQTVYRIAFAFIVYGIISILAIIIINRVIRNLTDGIYKYDSIFTIFSLFKFFIGIILLRLGQIFRNAEKLQQEQDLTV